MNGLVYVLAGAVLWGVAAVFSKVGVAAVGPWAAVAVRSAVFAAIVGGYVLARDRVRVEGRRTLVYAGLAGLSMGVGVVSVRFAYSLYEVSRVVPIQRLSVLVTVLLGVVLLDEGLTPRKTAGIALAVLSFLLLSP